MYCIHCGNKLDDDARFCTECGKPVELLKDRDASDATDVADAGAADAVNAADAADAGEATEATRVIEATEPTNVLEPEQAAADVADAADAGQATRASEPDTSGIDTLTTEVFAPESPTAVLSPQGVAPESRTAVMQPVVGAAGAPGAPAAPTAGATQTPAAVLAPEPTKRNNKMPLIIGAAALALLAAVGVGVLLGQRTTAEQPAATQEQTSSAQTSEQQSQAAGQAATQGSEQASSEAAASSAAQSTSSSDASSKAGADAEAEAQAKAIAEAQAAGKQVFTGTVMVQDAVTRMNEANAPNAIDTRYGNPVYSFLLLDHPATVTGKNPDGATAASEPYRTRDNVGTILFGRSDNNDAAGYDWSKLEGKHVTIACTQDELSFFSDSTGALFDAGAITGEILTENAVEGGTPNGQATSPTNTGDYVLPESGTRAYSRSELEALDNHTLFLARNEIYARHGRKFKNAELQQYFGSKSWYKPTIEPDAFADSILSSTEQANARLMLEIETARGSEYLK